MIQLDGIRWTMQFTAVDRDELFSAIRLLGPAYVVEIMESLSRVFADDPETINASLEVSSLDELLEVLNATRKVKSHLGNGICLMIETEHWSIEATLMQAKKECQTQSCQLLPNYKSSESSAALLSKITQAENAMNDLCDEIRKADVAKT